MTKVMMLPEHALSSIPADQLAKNACWSTAPIGTGPFKFTKYVSDQYVELAANTDYRGDKRCGGKDRRRPKHRHDGFGRKQDRVE
ncbi:ABC transporter substrate-binding protein, partial [Rhizobium ruizarguesonis]